MYLLFRSSAADFNAFSPLFSFPLFSPFPTAAAVAAPLSLVCVCFFFRSLASILVREPRPHIGLMKNAILREILNAAVRSFARSRAYVCVDWLLYLKKFLC